MISMRDVGASGKTRLTQRTGGDVPPASPERPMGDETRGDMQLTDDDGSVVGVIVAPVGPDPIGAAAPTVFLKRTNARAARAVLARWTWR